MQLLVYLLVIITISFIVLILYGLLFNTRENVMNRLDNVKGLFNDPDEDTIMKKPFNDRIIRPAYQKFIGFIGKATPYQLNQSLDRLIAHAGSPSKMNVNRLLGIMVMVSIIFPAFFFLINNSLGNKQNPLLLIVIGVLGFMLPIYSLRAKARARQTKIQKSLPDMLDLIFVSVEAGLGFDMALKRTTEKMPGPLSEELNRALDEINKGRNRDDALRGIVYRTGVEDLSSFITAVIQSEQLGSNIANMLRVQSSSMRQKRRQRAEELAMKVPIKMLFPLVFFMFPALFIVILGPAVIRIIDIFGEMF